MGTIMETRTSFRVFWITGGISVLVDLDHAYAALYKVWIDPTFTNSRFLHPLILVITCLFTLYLIAHLGRFYTQLVLRSRRQ